MKRISLFTVALLVCTPSLTQAYYCGCYGGVHYSPYAVSYYNSGLVPCGVSYSPYALSYGRSGLIWDCDQYTPYALSYYNSGLVPGYGICYPGWYGDGGFAFVGIRHRPAVRAAPRASVPVRRHVQAPPRPACPADGMNVIRQHLGTKGFASARIDRILRVDNQLLSVDFHIGDRNLLIKYWNPQELERLNSKEAYKQKVCAKYKQDWERYAEQYKQTGGEIYYVNASEPQAIIAALDACTKLSPGSDVQAPPVLYAKN